MLRWFVRILAGATALIALAIGVAAIMFLEFGERPASSLQPLAVAPDVKFVEANGIRFAYLEEGQGPLVLLFHGYPETARSWRTIQQRLAGAGTGWWRLSCAVIRRRRLHLMVTTQCRRSARMSWR